MDEREARARFTVARVARLATVRAGGAPHVVPVTFVLADDIVWFAVDRKPKRTTALQRLANIESEPRVSVLVDSYAEDWSTLWWVRADGRARVIDDPGTLDRTAVLLARKYPQYAKEPPVGPAVEIAVRRLSWWSTAEHRG